MEDLAARLAIAAAFVLALLAIAGRRHQKADGKRRGSAGMGMGHTHNQPQGQVSAVAAPPSAPRAWSAWDAVPPGLRDDETGRVIALSAVALKAHAAGVLVDLRGAVDRGEKPDDLVLVALEELAAPWRSWPETPPAADPPQSINA